MPSCTPPLALLTVSLFTAAACGGCGRSASEQERHSEAVAAALRWSLERRERRQQRRASFAAAF